MEMFTCFHGKIMELAGGFPWISHVPWTPGLGSSASAARVPRCWRRSHDVRGARGADLSGECVGCFPVDVWEILGNCGKFSEFLGKNWEIGESTVLKYAKIEGLNHQEGIWAVNKYQWRMDVVLSCFVQKLGIIAFCGHFKGQCHAWRLGYHSFNQTQTDCQIGLVSGRN